MWVIKGDGGFIKRYPGLMQTEHWNIYGLESADVDDE